VEAELAVANLGNTFTFTFDLERDNPLCPLPQSTAQCNVKVQWTP